MKARITDIRIQKPKEQGGGGGGSGGGGGIPENVDQWVPEDDIPERSDDGTIVGDDFDIEGPIGPQSENPGAVMRAGELGDLGGRHGLDGEALAKEWEDKTRIARSTPGKLPASLKRALDKLNRPAIDWKSELAKFIDDAISKSKYTLPARRFLGTGKAQYGYKRYKEEFENIVIAIDTSGSISKEMIEQFLGEVQGITQAYNPRKTVILYCDTQVYAPDILEPGDSPDYSKIAGGGGTNFWPPFKWVQQELIDKGEKPTVFIYFTDGFATFPSVNDYDISTYDNRCIWVFLSFNDEPFGTPQPFGERIDIILANKEVKRI